jgi:hypothetical protein
MQIQSISGWQDFIQAGREYLKTASNGVSRPEVFNNELVFQLAAMAIEKLIVGLAHYHHQMPVDNTLSGLVESLLAVCPLDPEMAERIRQIEAIDDMCALTVEHREPPGDDAIREILAVGKKVADFVDQHVPQNPPAPAVA